MRETFFWTVVSVLIIWVLFSETPTDCTKITADNFGDCHVEVIMGDE